MSWYMFLVLLYRCRLRYSIHATKPNVVKVTVGCSVPVRSNSCDLHMSRRNSQWDRMRSANSQNLGCKGFFPIGIIVHNRKDCVAHFT